MKLKNILFIVLILIMSMGTASAAILNVGSGYTYNTDGTADDVQINQAIKDASSGDTVYLHSGTFNIAQPIVMKSGVTLKGDGTSSTVIKVTSSALGNFNKPDVGIIELTNLEDVTLYGFTINGNDQADSHIGLGWENGIMLKSGGSDLTVHDIYITMINGDGIRHVPYPSGNTHEGADIYNIQIKRSGHDGIRAQAVSDWKISNMECDIYINYGVRFTDATNCELSYSTFTAKVGSGNAAVGIDGSSPGLSVNHCRFQNIYSSTNRHGILATDGTGEVTVTNNIFYKCYDGGIKANTNGLETFIISNNIFDSNAYAVNSLASAKLTNNIISNSTSYAINGKDSSRCTVTNCNIYGGSTSVSNAAVSGTLAGNPGYTNYAGQRFIPLASTAPLYSAMSSWQSAGYGVYNGDHQNSGSSETPSSDSSSLKVPVADFSSNVTSGNAPLTTAFTDTSTNSPTSWSWSFGDGATSTAKNPLHTYAQAGDYTVTLTASNDAGSNTITRSGYINVKTVSTTIEKPIVGFWGSRTSGTAPLTISFTDASTNTPTAWKWNFGDGTYSTEKNPKHTYAKAGTYSVTLTASNTAGSETKTRYDYIKVAASTTIEKPIVGFWGSRTSGKAPLTISFTDASRNTPTAWKWSFGDGTYSTAKNPRHTYTKTGTYSVTLTASNAAGSETKTRYNYIKIT